MSTLLFEDVVVPAAKHLAETYRYNHAEQSVFVAGFLEGWASAKTERTNTLLSLREDLETKREQAGLLWSGIVEAMLLLDEQHPASQTLQRALSLAELRRHQ